MYSDAKRIHLLEKVLKEKDEMVLQQVEELLQDIPADVVTRPSIMDLVGSIPEDEVDRMQRAIDEAFGPVDGMQIKTPFED